MTTSVFHRRRAERFAELLDQYPAQGPRHHVRSRLDDDLSTLVALGHRTATLQLTPVTEPDPGFRAELRAMLVATAERDGIGVTAAPDAAQPSRPVINRTRGAVIVGVAVGALALTGVAAASTDAMPGDPLYGVKRSTERVQLAMSGSDVARGQLNLDHARTRLNEAQAVTGDPDSFARVLGDMDSDTRQGVKLLTTSAVDRDDPAALDAVDSFVTDQRGDVAGVLDNVSGASRTRLLGSLNLLDQVEKRSQQLRETLTCGTVAGEGSDALGPLPRSCAPGANSATGTPPSSRPDTTQGTRPEGNTDPSKGPGASPTTPTGGAATSSPADVAGEPAQPRGQSPAPSPSTSPDSGVLGGLSKIIGDLLG